MQTVLQLYIRMLGSVGLSCRRESIQHQLTILLARKMFPLGFFHSLFWCLDRKKSFFSCDITIPSAGFLSSFFLMIPLARICLAADILTSSIEMTDGSTLVSAGNVFEFGFFSTANSTYMGIWYYGISSRTIIWVANRDTPVNSSSGILKIVEDGNAILQDNTGRILWSTNVQIKTSRGTFMQLLDSGNLVLRDDNKTGYAESYLWESFDQLSDTWLPGMKMGKDSRNGLNRYFTSWKSSDDPSPGQFTYRISPNSPPMELLLRRGNSVEFRTGPWNGVGFSGVIPKPNLVFNLRVIVNLGEMYYEYDAPDSKLTLSRSVLSYSGEIHRYVWNSSSSEWLPVYTLPNDPCDHYGHCGANSICTISDPIICSCLTGYMPKSPQDWEMQVWSGGCIHKHQLNCSDGEVFVEIKSVKVPDHWTYWTNTSMTLRECQAECLKNCSCTAYSNSNVSGRGSGCLLWHGDLIDIRRLSRPSNQNLYIRLSAVDLDLKKKKKVMLFVIAFSSAALAVLILACFVILKRRAQRRGKEMRTHSRVMADLELKVFKMIKIAEATNHFSNKIGEGGFGPVYKGQLATGQEIAVKRLAVDSNQGLEEFKNEVILIAKLQHRNLVRLLGCCIQGEEGMLVYEYMPNKSLNNYIYDSSIRISVTWRKRSDIIIGIARGLLYLHRDSRQRIIHRDLKASNILLDGEMNPKISDFGIARAIGGEQISAKTTRVIGTYGYMAPEYVIDGLYSMKSDVFSFGVLLLEIVSGRRNRDFHHPEHNLNLLGHAWNLWSEGRAYKLVDELMEEPFPISEVERYIQIGLLCVQKHPQDRPTMSTVMLMLDSEQTILPQPNQPGFYSERSSDDSEDHREERCTTANDHTITLLIGR